jgi:plastocyanin
MKKAFTLGIMVLVLVFFAGGCASQSPLSESARNKNASRVENGASSIVQNSGTGDLDNHAFDPATTKSIAIQEDSFEPPLVQIGVGDTITWTNTVPTEHSVKADTFSSGNLRKDETFSYQFPSAGTYDYACGLHPGMTGQIIVK